MLNTIARTATIGDMRTLSDPTVKFWLTISDRLDLPRRYLVNRRHCDVVCGCGGRIMITADRRRAAEFMASQQGA